MMLAALALGGAAGCGSEKDMAQNGETGEKTVVTMMYNTELPVFERLLEDTYPDIDLQIELNALATIDRETARRLRYGRGTDIVTSLTATENIEGYVMDLSAEDYASLYQSGITQSIMIDGRTMFIPMPGQYLGILYNATLTQQLGLPVPGTQSELLEMLDAAAQKRLGVGEDGTLFGLYSSDKRAVAYYLFGSQIPDFLGLADGIIWENAIQDKEGHFEDGMGHCLDMIEQIIGRGYLDPRYLTGVSGNHVPVKERMLNGTMLMTYGSVSTLNALNEESGQYEYDMLPFLSEAGNHPWTMAVPEAYLSLNKTLEEPGNEEKLDACQRILRLLSTPEGQLAVMANCGASKSYLAERVPVADMLPQGLKECVAEGYVYNLDLPGRILNYFGDRMVAALNGQITLSEGMAAVDNYYLNGDASVDYDQSFVGEMAEDMIYENYNVRQGETALGNLVADAVLEATGAEIGFVNGGAIRSSFYKGPVMGYDLDAVCPYKDMLVVLEVDGETIWDMLENGISKLGGEGIPGGRFLNVSGLCYSFCWPAGDSGAKLLSVTLPDGAELSRDKTYTIVVTDYMAGSEGYLDNNGDGYTMLNLYSDTAPAAERVKLVKETELTFADALQIYFANREGSPITAGQSGRIEVRKENE